MKAEKVSMEAFDFLRLSFSFPTPHPPGTLFLLTDATLYYSFFLHTLHSPHALAQITFPLQDQRSLRVAFLVINQQWWKENHHFGLKKKKGSALRGHIQLYDTVSLWSQNIT